MVITNPVDASFLLMVLLLVFELLLYLLRLLREMAATSFYMSWSQ